jgi:hypothetical protein
MHLSDGGSAFVGTSNNVAMATNSDDLERRIVNEFCHLLEKSKQLFNGLRDLPQYGHKQWQVGPCRDSGEREFQIFNQISRSQFLEKG